MDNPDCSTEHKKYQHLTSEERHIIEMRFNEDKWSIYAIAKSLGRPYNADEDGTNSIFDATDIRRRLAD